MTRYASVFLFLTVILTFWGCDSSRKTTKEHTTNIEIFSPVKRIDTDSLIVLYPKFSHIDLTCGVMPSVTDTSVILCAAASFTGQKLDKFDHFNIAGTHVSSGVRYRGFKSNRNTGAFVYYNNKWQFLYKNYESAINLAAQNGGMAFCQEMIIHRGQLVKSIRKDGSSFQFRALCDRDGQLCVIESKRIIKYRDFKQALLNIGVSNALYLDMGSGWNHAWYRGKGNQSIELHPKSHNYCTNWITFFSN